MGDARLFFIIIAILAAIPLIIVAGVFIAIPAAIVAVAFAVIKYLNRPNPITTAEIHQQTQVVVFPEKKEFGDHFVHRLRDQWVTNWPIYPIFVELSYIADTLYEQEGLLQMPLLTTFETPVAEGRYRDQLLAHTRKADHPGTTLDLFRATLYECFDQLQRNLPAPARIKEWKEYQEPPLSVPLRDILPNVGKVVNELLWPFYAKPVKELGLFTDFRKQINANQEEASKGVRTLVTAFPDPTLDTFRDVLTNGWEKYEPYIKKLSPDLQDFFYKEFNERMYADRRREVVQRLRLLLDNPSMAAML